MNGIDDFLNQALDRSRRCLICNGSEEIRADLERYVESHKSGATDVKVTRLHRDYLLPKYGSPKAAGTVRDHIRICLGYKGV